MTELNRPLLLRTVAHIRENPDTWNQALYRAEDRGHMIGCFATWACQLAGGIWYGLICLEAEPADEPRHVYRSGGVGVIDVELRARRVLGLSHDQAADLFNPSNNLAYLEQAVRELCDGTAPVTDVDAARARRERLRDEMYRAVDGVEPGPLVEPKTPTFEITTPEDAS